MTFKMKSMPLAVLQVLASGAFSAIVIQPALAQEVINDTPTQKVVVTGSFISRADKETESPVQTLTAADLVKSGYTSVSDVLRDITANGQGTISQSFNRAFAGGGSGVSLRGLTVGATLVLIDGHRMAPYPLSDDGQRPFVDISSIPFDAVERIEILKDGASSVYGSDAIAGVVNVILKKTIVGTTVSAEGGDSQKGGGATTHLSISHGFGDLDTDGYTGYVAAEFRHADAIRADQRSGDWTRTDWTGQGGYNGTPGVSNDFNSNPNTLSPYLIRPVTDPATQKTTNIYAFYPGCAGFTANKAACAFTDHWSQLQPQTENINLIASLTKKLGGDWQVNFKASMFDSKDQVEIAPQNYPHGAYVGNTALGPGITPHVVGYIPNFTVPTNYPGNTTGGPANIYGVITDLGGRVDNVDSKSYRVAADLTGSWYNWDLSASLGMSRIVTSQTYSNYVDRTALYNAINSPTNPYLIGGGNSAAMIASISPTFGVQQTDELEYIELRGSHELVKLPGGPMTLGLGTTFIHKALNAPDAAMFASGQINGNTAYAIGQQNDAAAFAELYAPIFKSLEVTGSARFDRYNTYGNSTTPKIGFKYTPFEQIGFRSTYSRGFRAPGPAENGNAGSTYSFNSVNDPLLCPGGSKTAAGVVPAFCSFAPTYLQTTTPDLKPEKSRSATFGLILEPVKGWSTTVDYYNIKISNQIVTASSLPGYVPNYVRGAPTPQTYSDGNGGTYIATPTVGQILYTTSPYVNAGSTQTSGVELDTSYRFKLGDYGSLKAEFQITHTIGYELTANGISYELAGTHGPTVTSGDTANPKNRIQAIFGYDKGPLNVTTTFNWIDGYSVLDPSTGPGANDTCQNSIYNSNNYFPQDAVPNQYCRVSSFLSTDLSASWKFTNGWTVHGSILNMFNRQPPVDLQTYGGTTVGVPATQLPYNPSLHQIGAVGRFFNFGASYHF
jgi:iron complex outermembrane receptor protein